jgi:hypothetical protein
LKTQKVGLWQEIGGDVGRMVFLGTLNGNTAMELSQQAAKSA